MCSVCRCVRMNEGTREGEREREEKKEAFEGRENSGKKKVHIYT